MVEYMCPSLERLLITFFISITEYPWDDTREVISSMCMPEPEVAIARVGGWGGGRKKTGTDNRDKWGGWGRCDDGTRGAI
jgi:hypothetical protein